MTLPPKVFNPSEISYITYSLPSPKAPGNDLITSPILKKLPRKAIIYLAYIYNDVLRTIYFPNPWQLSIVIMISKPKKPSAYPYSYRLTPVLPIMGQLLQKLILKRLIPILDSNHIIPDHLLGF